MKFNFKIQPFQTEATENIVRVFAGQHKQDRVSYRRDIGFVEADKKTMFELHRRYGWSKHNILR